jgi:hypothetical protein
LLDLKEFLGVAITTAFLRDPLTLAYDIVPLVDLVHQLPVHVFRHLQHFLHLAQLHYSAPFTLVALLAVLLKVIKQFFLIPDKFLIL